MKIQITENDIKVMAEAVVKQLKEAHRSGMVGYDGNGMVGGRWESNDFSEEVGFYADDCIPLEFPDEVFKEIRNYMKEMYTATVSGTYGYDESVGYGSSSSPIYEVEKVEFESAFKEDIAKLPVDDEMKEEIIMAAESRISKNFGA